MSETIHVLLTYTDGEDETYVNLFHTKEAVIQYIKDEIRRWWEEMHCEDVGEEDYNDLYAEQDEAEQSMNEHGYWNNHDGLTFVYDEKEFTA